MVRFLRATLFYLITKRSSLKRSFRNDSNKTMRSIYPILSIILFSLVCPCICFHYATCVYVPHASPLFRYLHRVTITSKQVNITHNCKGVYSKENGVECSFGRAVNLRVRGSNLSKEWCGVICKGNICYELDLIVLRNELNYLLRWSVVPSMLRKIKSRDRTHL